MINGWPILMISNQILAKIQSFLKRTNVSVLSIANRQLNTPESICTNEAPDTSLVNQATWRKLKLSVLFGNLVA